MQESDSESEEINEFEATSSDESDYDSSEDEQEFFNSLRNNIRQQIDEQVSMIFEQHFGVKAH